ncbi:MAG TPA: hypothetical protein VEW48_11870 [Thermoanaerobaculia bacterium]|nr:hypothetical protein [Thermoanaerobaculia bacterium]
MADDFTYDVFPASDDIIEPIAQLADVLRANAPAGLRWQYKPRPDLKHATIYRGEEQQVLRDLFAPREPSPPAPLPQVGEGRGLARASLEIPRTD